MRQFFCWLMVIFPVWLSTLVVSDTGASTLSVFLSSAFAGGLSILLFENYTNPPQ